MPSCTFSLWSDSLMNGMWLSGKVLAQQWDNFSTRDWIGTLGSIIICQRVDSNL